jgi:iron(II)-dependent oxidoreductase
MGAGPDGFAYDNERPSHTAEVGAFQIAHLPVSNASWMRFSEGGGYERREWWSDEGWAWKQDHDITHDPRLATGQARAPACHVSWFEAEAFARAHDARLPTEKEWEKAATWAQAGGGEERSGAIDAFGQVWEWTSSTFHGYPGFLAHPYREYSEVFFGETYRVLRGGSWATNHRIAGPTFRNWDLPIRRQIFSGVRLAREVV